MFEHRFRELLTSSTSPAVSPATPVVVPAAAFAAFAPCPMFHLFAATQQQAIQEVYRIAAERTREQLRPKPSRIPQFSLN
jgi:hypothetical protein